MLVEAQREKNRLVGAQLFHGEPVQLLLHVDSGHTRKQKKRRHLERIQVLEGLSLTHVLHDADHVICRSHEAGHIERELRGLEGVVRAVARVPENPGRAVALRSGTARLLYSGVHAVRRVDQAVPPRLLLHMADRILHDGAERLPGGRLLAQAVQGDVPRDARGPAPRVRRQEAVQHRQVRAGDVQAQEHRRALELPDGDALVPVKVELLEGRVQDDLDLGQGQRRAQPPHNAGQLQEPLRETCTADADLIRARVVVEPSAPEPRKHPRCVVATQAQTELLVEAGDRGFYICCAKQGLARSVLSRG
mmetsp:Transcript_64650/g.197719  ORF Transcript_64650/g.197719 Transcript_64650/m.197719 type:complete len:306 (-) Transcript_64650:523-1440(-)